MGREAPIAEWSSWLRSEMECRECVIAEKKRGRGAGAAGAGGDGGGRMVEYQDEGGEVKEEG